MATENSTSRQQLEATVRDVLTAALDRPIEPGDDVSQSTEAKWDSIKHIEILFMLEDALGVTFEDEDLAALGSLGGIVDRAAVRLGVQ